MGWFDEQIRQRIENDDEVFSEAFAKMADVVMGEHLSKMLLDERIKTQNAIEEILKYYYIKPKELPDNITTTMQQLEFMLRPCGIMWRTVELEGKWYQDAIGPMLGTRKEDGSAVALIPRGLGGYEYFDYKSGKKIRVTKTMVQSLDVQALCFYKAFPMKAMGLKDLVRYVLETIRIPDVVFILLAVYLPLFSLYGFI